MRSSEISLNLFFERASLDILTKAHMYGWKCGLKTGSYYIRTKPAISSQQFTIDPRNKEICESCSA